MCVVISFSLNRPACTVTAEALRASSEHTCVSNSVTDERYEWERESGVVTSSFLSLTPFSLPLSHSSPFLCFFLLLLPLVSSFSSLLLSVSLISLLPFFLFTFSYSVPLCPCPNLCYRPSHQFSSLISSYRLFLPAVLLISFHRFHFVFFTVYSSLFPLPRFRVFSVFPCLPPIRGQFFSLPSKLLVYPAFLSFYFSRPCFFYFSSSIFFLPYPYLIFF